MGEDNSTEGVPAICSRSPLIHENQSSSVSASSGSKSDAFFLHPSYSSIDKSNFDGIKPRSPPPQKSCTALFIGGHHDEYLEADASSSDCSSEKSLPAPTLDRELIGYVFQMLCALCLASCVITVRIAQEVHFLDTSVVAFVMGVVLSTLSSLYLAVFPGFRATFCWLRPHHWKLLLLRGIFGAIGLIMVATAVRYMPSGDVDAIEFLGPVITLFTAKIFLGEIITASGVFAAIISFIGAIIITFPASPSSAESSGTIASSSRFIGSMCALAAAIVISFAFLTLRSLSRVHFMTVVLSLGLFCSMSGVLLGGVVTPSVVSSNPVGLFYALVAAIAAFAGQCFTCIGFKYCRANTGAVVRTLEVLFVYIGAMLLFDERPTVFKALGSSMVVTGAVVIAMSKLWRT